MKTIFSHFVAHSDMCPEQSSVMVSFNTSSFLYSILHRNAFADLIPFVPSSTVESFC